MKIVGILLIVFGIAALIMGGISYTDRDKVLDIGPLEAETVERKTIPLSPVVGIVSVVAGIALVAVGSRRRV